MDELVDSGKVPARASSALELALSGWRLRNATYRELAEVSANVASRELAALQAEGVLVRHGQKRGSWYEPAADLAATVARLEAEAAVQFDAIGDPYRALQRGESIV